MGSDAVAFVSPPDASNSRPICECLQYTHSDVRDKLMAHKTLEKILSLDPVKDHQQIVFLTSAYEFPWDMTRALEFALFRTYAVPETSRLLAQTGEFVARAQKRYDDTDLLISTLYNYGYDSEQGQAALR